MKQSLRTLLFLFALIGTMPALAASENSLVTTLRSGPVDFDKVKSLEVGIQISSINSGSALTNLAFNHEFGDWFTGGIRALLPLEFGRPTQTFMGQLYGRFPLINTEDVVFIEPAVTQGFFSGDNSSPFWMLGASYSYFHRFGGDFIAGANIGADFSPSRIAGDRFYSSNGTVYSHLTITGGYYW